MRITVLQRGGLAVYGGTYDPRRDVAVPDALTQQLVEIVYPSTISAVEVGTEGIEVGTSTISGSKVSFTIEGPGNLTVIATMGSYRPLVRIESGSSASASIPSESYDLSDYADIFEDAADG